ncbi:unnamed protein product [Knipowitschia caucasica]
MPKPTRQTKQSEAGASQETESAAEANSSISLEKMMDVILDSMNKRFDLLDEKFETLTANQLVLTRRVDEAEAQGTDHERRIQALEQSLAEVRQTNMKLHSKLDDLEGRSRRNNIKIVGIPEGEEKGRPTEFVTSLIPKLLEQGNLAKQVIVDRAHRVPMPRATSTQRPRSIIARIHFYQEKEMLLRLSRQNQLVYNGARIFIYPDYTADVMTQRRGFRDVMQALREKEVTFILRFPARLQVNYEDQVKVFNSPAEAVAFIDRLQK